MLVKVLVSAMKRRNRTSAAAVCSVTTPTNPNPSTLLSSAVRTPRLAAGCGSVAAASILRASDDGELKGLVAADSEALSLGVAVGGLAGGQDGAADAAGDACAVRAGCGDVRTDGVVRIDGLMESPGVADDVSVGSQVGPALGPAEAAPAVV